jgi:hypothetical protein
MKKISKWVVSGIVAVVLAAAGGTTFVVKSQKAKAAQNPATVATNVTNVAAPTK